MVEKSISSQQEFKLICLACGSSASTVDTIESSMKNKRYARSPRNATQPVAGANQQQSSYQALTGNGSLLVAEVTAGNGQGREVGRVSSPEQIRAVTVVPEPGCLLHTISCYHDQNTAIDPGFSGPGPLSISIMTSAHQAQQAGFPSGSAA